MGKSGNGVCDLSQTPIVSVTASSSIEFLEFAFACYAKGDIFAISRADTNLEGKVGDVTAHILPEHGTQGWAKLYHAPKDSPAPAQIVFTSGTEGPPKPIVLSHHNLAHTTRRLNEVMQVTEKIREYIGVPVTYSFGLGRARAVASAGGEVFLPDRFDPSEIRDMLETGSINAISAVPSLWRVILSNPEIIGQAGMAVRWIEIGSQYMSGADKAQMCRLFPNARIVQHYGLTEASRSTFLVISEASEVDLESVGTGFGGVETRINTQDAIEIRGEHIAMGLLGADGTVSALTDADGWFTTQDRGRMDGKLLFYEGRLDNQINISGIKVSAEALESDIHTLVNGASGLFAITSLPDPMRGDVVLLGIETKAGQLMPLIETATQVALQRRGIAAGGVLKTISVDALPRTGTDKIQRAELRAAYSPQPGIVSVDPTDQTIALSPVQDRLAKTWCKVVGQTEITPDQTFYDLGGDSLSSVQIGLAMEAAHYNRNAVRATLEGRSLDEVVHLADQEGATEQDYLVAEDVALIAALHDATTRSWALSMTRAIMVISVLISHWGPGLFSRLKLQDVEPALNLIYRMGTPGFAVVFGIGIGMYMLPEFSSKKASVYQRLKTAFLLILFGMILLAVTRIILDLLKGIPLDGYRISIAFYGVLGYYILMLGSARLWLPALDRLRRPITVLAFGAPVLWVFWQAAVILVPSAVQNNLLEWPRLMGQAGYNIFKMTALASGGMAVGLWFSRQQDAGRAAQQMIVLGFWGMMISVLILLQAEGWGVFAKRTNLSFTSLPGLIFYSGAAVFMLGSFLWLLQRWQTLPTFFRQGLHVLLAIGGLALPIYVFHALVIPVRDILYLLGVPGSVALLIPLGLFVAGAVYGGGRLYRIYTS